MSHTLTSKEQSLAKIFSDVTDGELQKDITGCIYEKGSLVKGPPARYRLVLRERHREFFRDHVQHENGQQVLAQLNTVLPDAHRSWPYGQWTQLLATEGQRHHLCCVAGQPAQQPAGVWTV